MILQRSEEEAEEMNSTNKMKSCSCCHTTRTPLWRSGPSGPKVKIRSGYILFVDYYFDGRLYSKKIHFFFRRYVMLVGSSTIRRGDRFWVLTKVRRRRR